MRVSEIHVKQIRGNQGLGVDVLGQSCSQDPSQPQLGGHSITTWTRKGGRGLVESPPAHVMKSRYYVKCPCLFTRGVRRPKFDRIWSTQLFNAPLVLPPSLLCLTRKHDPGPDGEILLLPYVHVGIGYIYVRTSTYVQLCCLSVSFGIIASITNGSSCCMQKMTMTK